MKIANVSAWAATVVAAAGAGWWAGGAGPSAAPLAAPAAAARAIAGPTPAPTTVSAGVPGVPLIAVSSDGQVTLRVEQQPLQWVLEQIAVQAGWAEIAATARPGPAGVASSGAGAEAGQPPCAAPAMWMFDGARLQQVLEHGSEPDRLEALQQARAHHVPVDQRTLKALYESGSSERLRLAAFDAHLELLEERPEAQRLALEAAMGVPSATIQREALQRLAALHTREGIEVPAVQGSP